MVTRTFKQAVSELGNAVVRRFNGNDKHPEAFTQIIFTDKDGKETRCGLPLSKDSTLYSLTGFVYGKCFDAKAIVANVDDLIVVETMTVEKAGNPSHKIWTLAKKGSYDENLFSNEAIVL